MNCELNNGAIKWRIEKVRREEIQLRGIIGCTTLYDGIHLLVIMCHVIECVVGNIRNGMMVYQE